MTRRSVAGLTLLEVVVATAILGALFLLVIDLSLSARSSYFDANARLDSDASMRRAMWALADDLRAAAPAGEDLNGNGALDAGEDLNGNGVLEADWAVSAAGITLNRRNVDGTVSSPVSYSLQGTSLQRIADVAIGGAIKRQATTVGRNVTAFAVTADAASVTVAVTMQSRASETVTESITVSLRGR